MNRIKQRTCVLLLCVSFLVTQTSSMKNGPGQQREQDPIIEEQEEENPNTHNDHDSNMDEEDMQSYSTIKHIFQNFEPNELEYEIQYLDRYGHLSPRGFLYLFHSRIRGETLGAHNQSPFRVENFTSSAFEESIVYTESELLDWDISEHGDMAYICQHWNGLACHERTDNGLYDTCWCVDENEMKDYDWSEDSDSTNTVCIDQCARNVESGRIYAKNQAPKDAITAIGMELWNLVGEMFPRDIKSLRFLEEINLHGNFLIGSLPDTIGSLEGLRSLRLSGCTLYELPSELQNLRKLEHLELNSCRLSGSPDFIENLSSLKELSMSDNQDIGWNEVPYFLSRLSNLEYLDVSEMSLSGVIPQDLSNLTKLNILDLEKNLIKGTLPVEISMMPNLHILKLSGNDLSGTLPTDWTSSIEYIEIASNLLTGHIPSNIFQPNLIELILYKNKLSGTIPTEVNHSKRLSRLELDLNLLEGNFPLDETAVEEITHFEIHGNLLIGEVDESWCDAIDWSDRTMYPFEYANFPCTNFIACPKGYVSRLGYATDLDSCVHCPSCGDDPETNGAFCDFIGQPITRCADANGILHQMRDVKHVLLDPLLDISSLEQREILRKLFIKMHGYAWEKSFHAWGDLRHENPCTLPGIECANDRIVSITLESANICSNISDKVCEIPDEIALLGNSLEVLKLSAGSFVEHRLVIPPTIKYLRKLKQLVLANARLDDLPQELIECKNLHELELKNCVVDHDFQDTIIWDLTWLQKLNIESSNLKNQYLPSKIGMMTELTHLKIAVSNVGGHIPSEIGNLSKLKEVELYSNNLTGSIPETFSQLKTLARFDLYNNKLEGSVEIISAMSKLVILNLNDNQFSGTIPNEITELSELFWVDMGRNHLHGTIPSNFSKLPSLIHLRLGGNAFAPLISEDICQMHINEGPYDGGNCNHVICPIGSFSEEGFARKDDSCKPCPDGQTTKTIGSIGVSSCYTPTEYDYLMLLYNAISAGKGDPSMAETAKDACAMKELDVVCDENGEVISFSIPLSGITYDENVPWI